MERKYVCIDCGKEFIVESRRATHAKRCPVCRKLHRRSYDKQWKINKRLLDPEYAANMQNSYVKKKFLEDPISFYKHRMFIAAKARAKKSNLPFNICEDDIVIPSYIGKLGFEDTVFIEADSISEAEKLFDENFHKRKLIGVRESMV